MRQLHVTNGDCAADLLRVGGMPGEITVYADILHDGPVRGLDDDAHFEERARFISDIGLDSYAAARARLGEWNAPLVQHDRYDEVVIWVEHDLFDQLLLIRHLACLRQRSRTSGVFIVQADDYIGHMTPEQVASLPVTRIRAQDHQFDVAARAWEAFTCDSPCALARLLKEDTAALPHLAPAIERLLQEYPTPDGGPGRLDRQILALNAQGITDRGALFGANAALEERIYLGDDVFFWRARTIGQDRWIGGTLLTAASPWRFDPASGRMQGC